MRRGGAEGCIAGRRDDVAKRRHKSRHFAAGCGEEPECQRRKIDAIVLAARLSTAAPLPACSRHHLADISAILFVVITF